MTAAAAHTTRFAPMARRGLLASTAKRTLPAV
jgi:hypothetical protein